VTIAFPKRLSGAAVDRFLAAARARGEQRSLACWSLDELPGCRRLGARLLARGFEWGWQPHWMWLDLGRLADERFGPAELKVEVASKQRGVWRATARLEGERVGGGTLNVTTGRLGAAGIYDIEVAPPRRGRGIGKAITYALLRRAVELGCRHALLNSTGLGEPVYRRLGFASLGRGQTWWLHRHVLAAKPPDAAEVALVEAIGRDSPTALERAAPPAELLDRQLACGMTAMRIAAQLGTRRAAEWLASHGATLDPVAAWDLGWRDRLPSLLAEQPELANWRAGNWQATPLHEAALRDDVELARVVLAGNPDLTMKDRQYGSTPLGWARHMGRSTITALIEGHGTGVVGSPNPGG
jgi:GNAT superfamily N-acetyltransferase